MLSRASENSKRNTCLLLSLAKAVGVERLSKLSKSRDAHGLVNDETNVCDLTSGRPQSQTAEINHARRIDNIDGAS